MGLPNCKGMALLIDLTLMDLCPSAAGNSILGACVSFDSML